MRLFQACLFILAVVAVVISGASIAVAQESTSSFVGSMGRFSRPEPRGALPGKYLRRQIQDSQTFPLRTIGRLDIIGKKLGSCTATLVGDRFVLTAAHCVYNLEKKTWMSDLRFLPGQTGQNKLPFNPVDWERVYVPKQYLETPASVKTAAAFGFDYAIIVLKEKVGVRLGWLGLTAVEDAINAYDLVSISGYPGDKNRGTFWDVSCPMARRGSQWQFQCDSFQGMSGSALRVSKADRSGSTIVGVLDWGQDDKPGTENFNGGVIITSEILAQMKSWLADRADAETIVLENNLVPTVEIYVRNTCPEATNAQVTVRYLSAENQWVQSSQWVPVAVGETIKVARTFPGINYYFFTANADNDLQWKGDSLTYIQGQPEHMIKVSLGDETLAKGIEVRDLTCNP